MTTKKDRVTSELLERVYELCLQSAQHDIALTIDAEEQDRLELSLYLNKRISFKKKNTRLGWSWFSNSSVWEKSSNNS